MGGASELSCPWSVVRGRRRRHGDPACVGEVVAVRRMRPLISGMRAFVGEEGVGGETKGKFGHAIDGWKRTEPI